MHPAEYDRMFALEDGHWWYRAVRELVEWHVRRAAAGKAVRILDAGCGTGALAAVLQKYGSVSALDASAQAVAYCRQRGVTAVACVDLRAWDAPECAYDIIVCVDVLYHAGIGDDAAVVKKFCRALAPKGMLVVHLPAFECLRRGHDIVVATKRRYTRRQARSLLAENGFEVRECCYRMPWLFLAALVSKWRESRHAPRGEERSDLQQVTPLLNAILLAVARFENIFVRRGVGMPFGSSICLVATKANVLEPPCLKA